MYGIVWNYPDRFPIPQILVFLRKIVSILTFVIMLTIKVLWYWHYLYSLSISLQPENIR